MAFIKRNESDRSTLPRKGTFALSLVALSLVWGFQHEVLLAETAEVYFPLLVRDGRGAGQLARATETSSVSPSDTATHSPIPSLTEPPGASPTAIPTSQPDFVWPTTFPYARVNPGPQSPLNELHRSCERTNLFEDLEDAAIYHAETIQYNELGVEIRKDVDQDADGDIEFSIGRSTNARGQWVSIHWFFLDRRDVPRYEILEYDEQHRLKVWKRDWDGDSVAELINSYEYDSAGNMIAELKDTDGDGSTDKTRRLTFEHDRLVREESDDDLDDQLVDVENQFFWKDGKLEQITTQNFGSLKRVTTFLYDEFGRPFRREIQLDSDPEPDIVWENYYDENGRSVGGKRTGTNGKVDLTWEFEYDSAGRLAKWTTHDDHGLNLVEHYKFRCPE